MEKDFIRPEGVYVSAERTAGGEYSVLLFTIERVNGDCSISSLGCTEDEAKSLIEQLQVIFKLNGT